MNDPVEIPGRGSLIVNLLQRREGRPTLVELSNGRLLDIRNIVWGRDPGDNWEHVTINVSPPVADAVPDNISTRDVARIIDPASGSILEADHVGPTAASPIRPRACEPGIQSRSAGLSSLMIDLLEQRENTLTIVELDGARRRRVFDIAGGIDIGNFWEHVSTNTAHRDESFDFFHTSEIVRVTDPLTASTLLCDRTYADRDGPRADGGQKTISVVQHGWARIRRWIGR
ncbi:MAG: hypothetical protein INR65_02235 [Gluconacetobacter diazotrophicus]|nr:hypothetical protein [Gluconacetobacter diazotrophicus]